MPAPTITALPPAPDRADAPATFVTDADTFVAALPELVTDINAFGTYLDGLALSGVSGPIISTALTMATARVLGRTTASSGAIEELTATQLTAFLNAFTTSLQGLVPASGGGTSNFLRADGTWAAPPGSGSAITAKDEGSNLTTAMTSIDFVGSGVAATNTGGAVTVTVSGTGSGGDHSLAPPDTSLFSLTNNYNSATMSATYSAGKGLSVKRTDTGASSADRLSFTGKAVPAGSSWSVEMGLRRDTWDYTTASYLRAGLMLLENSTGKWIFLSLNSDNGTTISINSWRGVDTTSNTSISALTINRLGFPPYIRFRIDYDGTTYSFFYSLNDGIDWIAHGTVAKATAFTTAADRSGVGMQTYNTFTTNWFNPTIIYYDDPDV